MIADAAAVTACVKAAYALHTARMGKPPGPVLDDYGKLICEHTVWVYETATTDETINQVAGILVLINKADYLLLDNVAVHPQHQGKGTGQKLMELAETEAAQRGYARIQLYTHESMIDNQQLYKRRGYTETKRISERGLNRVYMEKRVGL